MKIVKQLEKEISNIKQRNKKVEADKAWETSFSRKLIIIILTYFVIVIFFYIAKLPDPWINAIVPSVAFVLSTLTIPVFKKIWIRYFYR
ncbi:hypothetical protein COV16_01225 [Candidatus Woesearchaeota archaeon CG10_big_fil_rev_8_21_14_0_10_34_8]|nr:MAG: hypothetical protein COV16_01225 [Candidatus Woesearchaeota archaeon CG10_big_fil_rev_8_21_14_0_10_34_8]